MFVVLLTKICYKGIVRHCKIKIELDEDCGRVCKATPKEVSSHLSQGELRLSQVKGPQLDRTLKSFKHRRGNFILKETLRLITEQKAFIRFLLFLSPIILHFRRDLQMLIITNNSMVKEYYEDRYEILFLQGKYREVLINARDRIHNGYKLLTHPLSGSIKPGETPYKSLVISKEAGKALDLHSLELIESAIAVHDKFMTKCRYRDSSIYTEEVLEDFREVDFTLLQSALN